MNRSIGPRRAQQIEQPRAVVLYGRIGSYTQAARSTAGNGSAGLVRMCALGVHTHVLTPWRQLGQVDVFVQSWNPELGTLLNRLYAPAAYEHAAQDATRFNMSRCHGFLCARNQWALLGMQRALALRRTHEGSTQYATVLMMRHDLHWLSPLPHLPTTAVRMWLPFHCAVSTFTRLGGRVSLLHSGHELLGQSFNATISSGGFTAECSLELNATSKMRESCELSITVDWWMMVDSRLADDWERTVFSGYSRALRAVAAAPVLHHYWGLFVRLTNLRERCELGFATHALVDFQLGRYARQEHRFPQETGSPVLPTPPPRCRFEDWHTPSLGWTPSAEGCRSSTYFTTMCPREALPSSGLVRQSCNAPPDAQYNGYLDR